MCTLNGAGQKIPMPVVPAWPQGGVNLAKQKRPGNPGRQKKLPGDERTSGDFNHNQFDAPIIGGVGVARILLGLQAAFGIRLKLVHAHADSGQIFQHRIRPPVAQAEIVLGRAAPVGVTFEHHFVARIFLEVFLGRLKFGTFAFLHVETVEIEIHGFENATVALGVVHAIPRR